MRRPLKRTLRKTSGGRQGRGVAALGVQLQSCRQCCGVQRHGRRGAGGGGRGVCNHVAARPGARGGTAKGTWGPTCQLSYARRIQSFGDVRPNGRGGIGCQKQMAAEGGAQRPHGRPGVAATRARLVAFAITATLIGRQGCATQDARIAIGGGGAQRLLQVLAQQTATEFTSLPRCCAAGARGHDALARCTLAL